MLISENLGVTTPDYYYYLNQSGTFQVDGTDDNQEFQDTLVSHFRYLSIDFGTVSGLRFSARPVANGAQKSRRATSDHGYSRPAGDLNISRPDQ